MINYVKKNKIFTILLTLMILILTFLSSQFFLSQDKRYADNSSISEDDSVNTNVKNFSISFDQHYINFNWDIVVGKDGLDSAKIYYHDKELADVTALSAYSLDLINSDVSTGNASFSLVLTNTKDKKTEKTTSIYIDEVFDINVNDEYKDNKITYTITYYYEADKPVNAPKIDYLFSSGVNNYINYDSVERDKVNERFMKASAYYNLDLSKAEEGNYKADLTWKFDEYGITYDSQNSFNVVK